MVVIPHYIFFPILGIAVDGGKDSLSMAARVGKDTVKAPGTLVVSTYAPCPDIRKVRVRCLYLKLLRYHDANANFFVSRW